MEVSHSRWCVAVLVLPSEVCDVDMIAYEGVVAMAPNTEDEAALFSTQVGSDV
jgi:hypothetical protein